MKTVVVLTALCLSASAEASEKVELRKQVTKDAAIRVNNVSGSLEIVGWDKNELEVTGTIGSGVETVELSGEPDHAQVKVVLKRNEGDGKAELVIRVPERSRVRYEVVSASVQASRLLGTLEGEAVSGSARIEGALKEAALKTVSGSVRAQGVLERVQVKAVSGEIDITDAAGEVAADSVSGSIHIAGKEFSRAAVKTVSGSIRFDGALKSDGRYDLESHSGSLEIVLPASTSATFDISTFSGSIKSELGGVGGESRGFGPGKESHFTAGQDGARVSLKSFSGSIAVKKR